MKKTQYDPILSEMHAIKDAISAEFNHDVDALFDHLRKVERGSISVGQKFINSPKRPVHRLFRKTGMRRREIGTEIAG